jgi:hypothetical protein
MTEDNPSGPAMAGELTGLARSLVPLRAELARLQACDNAATIRLRHAVHERLAAMSLSVPATPEDFLALGAHSLEQLSIVATAYDKGHSREEVISWLIYLEVALWNLMQGFEMTAGKTMVGLGLLSNYVTICEVFGLHDAQGELNNG